jgi:hypothetical protein
VIAVVIMPSLKNHRHELMAQGVAKGLTQTKAYIEAGYSQSDARAKSSRLLATNGNIQGRVKELQKQAAILCELTVADLIEELEHSRQLAARAETPQSSAMVAATMAKAKLLGFLVTRPEVSAPKVLPIDYSEKVAELTDAELNRFRDLGIITIED